MFELKREQRNGVWKSLGVANLIQAMHEIARAKKMGYAKSSKLVVLDTARDELVVAEWTPETGWVGGPGVEVLADPLVRVLEVAEISDRIYDATSTIESGHLGADLAYLYAAIVKKTSVEFGRRNDQVLAILREEFPETHSVWTHIDVEETEKAEPRPMVREDSKSRTLVCPECGNETFECEGVAHLSQVSVDAHIERSGEVHVGHDWMDAGSAEFEPGEISCSSCGQAVVEPDPENIGVYEDDKEG